MVTVIRRSRVAPVMKAHMLEESFVWLLKLLRMIGRGPEGR